MVTEIRIWILGTCLLGSLTIFVEAGVSRSFDTPITSAFLPTSIVGESYGVVETQQGCPGKQWCFAELAL